jgi:hypothetical protein
MTAPDSDRPNLNRDEEAFVRKLATSYTAPPLSPRERTDFHARLERRIGRPRALERWPLFAGGAAATALALFVFARVGTVTPPASEDRMAADVASSTTAENVILALVDESAGEPEAELPDDYLAIEEVFLGD